VPRSVHGAGNTAGFRPQNGSTCVSRKRKTCGCVNGSGSCRRVTGASERQVCFALQVSRSSFRYRSVAAGDSALRLRIREITETRVHYGYRRVHILLRREGWRDNHKRIHRLHSEQGLSLRPRRPRRNKPAQRRQPRPQGLYPAPVRGMDFVPDALSDGRRLRLLTIIDLFTRECPGICVGAESALNGSGGDSGHHCARTSLTTVAENR